MKKFCLDFSFVKWQKVAVICFLLIVQVALILCIYIFPFFVKKVDQPTKSFIIILDAGHGGIDGGVIGSLTGVKESDLNLEITFKLKKALTERGAKVVLTRQDKNGLYDEYIEAANKGQRVIGVAVKQNYDEDLTFVALIVMSIAF